MIIRRAQPDDIPRLLDINNQNDFPLPKFEKLLTQAVIECNGIITAFGMVKIFAEAILVLDKHQSQKMKVEALQLLMSEAIRGCRIYDVTQLHAFIKDEHFEQVMKKHYGFEDCSGKALVLNL